MPSVVATSHRRLAVRIALAAATVALLDFSYVFVLWVVVRHRITTVRLLQSIATGLLGKDAYTGGARTALLGGVLHISIAIIWTLVYLLLVSTLPQVQRLAASSRSRFGLGLGYGVLVWWSMALVVLPLSRARAPQVLSWDFLIDSCQHACMVGLPIALILGAGMPSRPRLET